MLTICYFNKVKGLIQENQVLENCIRAGPGWTKIQIDSLDKVLKETETKRSLLKQGKDQLDGVKKEIRSHDDVISDRDHLREEVMKEIEIVDKEMDISKQADQDLQGQIMKIDQKVETLDLSTIQEKDDLKDLKTKQKHDILKRKSSQDELINKQTSLEKNTRKLHENSKVREKLMQELQKQKEKNQQIDVKNTGKVCEIGDRKKQIQCKIKESNSLSLKKNLMSNKISEIEEERLQLEHERDHLKLNINKLVHGELNTQKREFETLRRQKEVLKREINLLERKKGLSEKSSQVALDLVKASNITCKSLHHDLRSNQTKAGELRIQIQSLSEDIQKKHDDMKMATKRAHCSLAELSEQEALIQSVQKELENSEIQLKQKQYICEAIKNECNTLSKSLVKNYESIERVKRETNVVDRQINQLKMDISTIEVQLVSEHFDHHNANTEKDLLQNEIYSLQEKIDEMGRTLGMKQHETFKLHQSVDMIDQECDKQVKEYGAIIGYRDSIGNILLRKNEELERIQEKIKIQQSLLNHCDVEYQELMAQITKIVDKLKRLESIKSKLDEESSHFVEHLKQCNYLETKVQQMRNKNMALKEEVGRPLNIHRWRILEHRNPKKFEKIQKIQRLQTFFIDIAGRVGDREISFRETELDCLETKRMAERQPRIDEISQQLSLYHDAVIEKCKEKNCIEIDLTLVKQEVESLKQILKNLDKQREEMKMKWIDSNFVDTFT